MPDKDEKAPIEGVDQEELGTDAAAEAVKKTEAEAKPAEDGGEKAAPEAGTEELKDNHEQQVDDAKAQHEKDGTWPENTPDWVKKTVNRATRKKYEFKDKADSLAKENEELRKKLAEKEVKPLGDKPAMNSFDSEEDFIEALTDWKLDKRETENATSTQENHQKTQQETAKQDFEGKVDTMFDSGGTKHDDFVRVVTEVPGDLFRNEVIAAIVEVDNADEVAYFLAGDLNEAERISKMNGTQRAIAIGQISVRLATPPPKKPSEAPDPIRPGGSNNNGTVDDSKLTDDEWLAKRNAS